MRDVIAYLSFAILCGIGCGGQQLPEVTISLPVDNTSVCGITTVLVVTEDNETVDSVTLFIDDSIACGFDERPFLYSWNTHPLDDNTEHFLYACACDKAGNEGVSDTVFITIDNGPLLFGDGFESYIPGLRPVSIWQEIWPGVIESTYVSPTISNEGEKSYHSFGYAAYVRTDGVGFDTTGVAHLTYEVSVLVPDESANGALIGLFHRINPELGEIYNGVMFSPTDHHVHIRGMDSVVTSFVWEHGVWYGVRVEVDFTQELMDVWIDTSLVAESIATTYSTLTDTFALSTIYGYNGGVYYDMVRVLEE